MFRLRSSKRAKIHEFLPPSLWTRTRLVQTEYTWAFPGDRQRQLCVALSIDPKSPILLCIFNQNIHSVSAASPWTCRPILQDIIRNSVFDRNNQRSVMGQFDAWLATFWLIRKCRFLSRFGFRRFRRLTCPVRPALGPSDGSPFTWAR